MKRTQLTSSVHFIAALAILAAPHAEAASGTWTGGNGTNIWGDSSKWADTTIADGAGSTATLSFTGASTVNIDSDRTLGILNIASTSGIYNLGATNSATLTMDNNGAAAQINLTVTGASTYSVPLFMTAGGLNITATGGQATISGAISSIATSGTQVLNVANSGGSVFTLSGNISDGSSEGVGVLLSAGGIVTLTGSNTFSKGVTVEKGELRLGTYGAGDGSITLGGVNSGASTIFLNAQGNTISNDIVVSSNGTGAVTIRQNVTGGANVFSGDITLGRAVTAQSNAAGSLSLTGNISGTGKLNLGVTGGAGQGYILLSGSNTLHTGGGSIEGGNVQVRIGRANALGTGAWSIGAAAGQQPNVQIDNVSGAAMTLAHNNALSISNFTFVGTHDLNLGTGNVTVSNTAAIITVKQNKLTVGGVISGANKSIGNAGDGTLALTAANTYTGYTSVGGILEVTSLANGGVASNIGASTNAASNLVINRGSLRYTGGATSTDRLFTIGNGGGSIDSSGSGAMDFTNTGAIVSTDTVSLSLAPGNNTFASGTNILHVAYSSGPTPNNTANLEVGMTVSGAGIPAGTTITKILDGGRIEISQNTTAQATNSAYTFSAMDRTFTLTGSNTGDNTIAGSFQDSASKNLSLNKTGTGKWILTGTSTHTGATTVNQGTLLIGGDGSINSSVVSVSAGAQFVYNSSVARTGAITLNGNGASRAILSGTGVINTALVLDNVGDTLAPGNSPGIMTLGVSQEWSAFTYLWEVNDFTGLVAGTNFDQVNITGGLSLTGGEDSYVFDLRSLTLADIVGDLANFSDVNRSWTILTTTAGITGFDANHWTILTGQFTTETPWGGSWSISQSGGDLVLNYNAIPEPSTSAIALLGAGVAFLYRRRNSRAA